MKRNNLMIAFFIVVLLVTGCAKDGELYRISDADDIGKEIVVDTELPNDEELPNDSEPVIGTGALNGVDASNGTELSYGTELSNGAGMTPDAGGLMEPDHIYVYVCGAVMKEGVFSVEPGTRKDTLLSLAGGYSQEAAAGVVNLAEIAEDGERVYFPTKDEVSSGEYPGGRFADETDTEKTGKEKKGESDGRVNLNTVGKDELMQLPGIGEEKADAIIRYRSEFGGFREPEDIMQVSGIKEGTYEKLKPFITVR